MELFILEQDVPVFCVTVRSFPNGIIEAFKTLEKMHPSVCDRPFYGIFFPNKNGKMIYKAAVEEAYKNEGKTYGCETSVITKGGYLAERIVNYMENINAIPDAFKSLSADSRIDENFPCVEWYKSASEVLCMIKLKPGKT